MGQECWHVACWHGRERWMQAPAGHFNPFVSVPCCSGVPHGARNPTLPRASPALPDRARSRRMALRLLKMANTSPGLSQPPKGRHSVIMHKRARDSLPPPMPSCRTRTSSCRLCAPPEDLGGQPLVGLGGVGGVQPLERGGHRALQVPGRKQGGEHGSGGPMHDCLRRVWRGDGGEWAGGRVRAAKGCVCGGGQGHEVVWVYVRPM